MIERELQMDISILFIHLISCFEGKKRKKRKRKEKEKKKLLLDFHQKY